MEIQFALEDKESADTVVVAAIESFCLAGFGIEGIKLVEHGTLVVAQVAVKIDCLSFHNHFTHIKLRRGNSLYCGFLAGSDSKQSCSLLIYISGPVEPVRNFVDDMVVFFRFQGFQLLLSCFGIVLVGVRVVGIDEAGSHIDVVRDLLESLEDKRQADPLLGFTAVDIKSVKVRDTRFIVRCASCDDQCRVIIPADDGCVQCRSQLLCLAVPYQPDIAVITVLLFVCLGNLESQICSLCAVLQIFRKSECQ